MNHQEKNVGRLEYLIMEVEILSDDPYFPSELLKAQTRNWGFKCQFVAQLAKNPPAMWETWVWSLGWEEPQEKGKATHSSILAWRIPWTIWSMGLQSVGHDWATFAFTRRRQWQPTPVLSPGKSYGQRSLVGCSPWVAQSWTRLRDFTFTFPFMHWRRQWQPTPVFLPRESQGRGGLVGCHLWGHTESDMNEVI